MNDAAREHTLVTGGCGFVGRHLIKRLLQDRRSIWVIDNLSTGRHPDTWIPDGFEKKSATGSVLVYENSRGQRMTFILEDAVRVFSDELGLSRRTPELSLPDCRDIFHLASIVGGRMVIEGDPMAVALDLAIDALFFRWAVVNSSRIGKILYASSSAAYPILLQGDQDHMKLKEEYIAFDGKLGQPDMTYGWSKLTGEYLSTLAASKYGLHVACVRPFSGYGEDQDLSYPVPAIALRVAKRENPLAIWGTGKQGRDFVHIDDCIDAMLRILERVSDGRGINIGSGVLTTFIELATLMAEIEGYQPVIKPLVDKPEGVKSRYCDPLFLNTGIGWSPSIPLREGMSRVLAAAHQRASGSVGNARE
jgi:UDP-glucose 4-epimerase